MLRILSLILTILILFGGAVVVAGYRTSPEYSDSVTFNVSYPVDMVWQKLVSIEEIPRRKNDVKSVTVLEQFGKLVAWKETLNNGGYRIYRMNERQDNKKLTLELTESSYGLTGIWTYEIRPVENNDTQITLTEKSTLTNAKIRGYRVFLGRDHDMLVWIKYINVGLVQALLITP